MGVEQPVLKVRDAHPAWGARKIARVLRRAGVVAPAHSTVHAVLRRHERITPPPGGPVAYQRFAKPAPNLAWRTDFKGWVTLENGVRCHPLTVVDDHSRYLLCLRPCEDQQGNTVQGMLETTFRRYGLPDAMFVDNGPPPPSQGQAFADRAEAAAALCGGRELHLADVINGQDVPSGTGRAGRFTPGGDDLLLRYLRAAKEPAHPKFALTVAAQPFEAHRLARNHPFEDRAPLLSRRTSPNVPSDQSMAAPFLWAAAS